MKMGSPKEFFHFMEEQGGPRHTYTGELYFSSHRGTYTSQAKIKKYNRACELAPVSYTHLFIIVKAIKLKTNRSEEIVKLPVWVSKLDVPLSSLRVLQKNIYLMLH